MGESISSTTQIFVPIWQCFNFTRNLSTHFTQRQILPQTTIPPTPMIFSVPKRNIIKCFHRPATIFNFTTHFTTNFTTNHYHYSHPPQCFLYLRETHVKFWEACKVFDGVVKIWWESWSSRSSSSSRSKSPNILGLGFWFYLHTTLTHEVQTIRNEHHNLAEKSTRVNK